MPSYTSSRTTAYQKAQLRKCIGRLHSGRQYLQNMSQTNDKHAEDVSNSEYMKIFYKSIIKRTIQLKKWQKVVLPG